MLAKPPIFPTHATLWTPAAGVSSAAATLPASFTPIQEADESPAFYKIVLPTGEEFFALPSPILENASLGSAFTAAVPREPAGSPASTDGALVDLTPTLFSSTLLQHPLNHLSFNYTDLNSTLSSLSAVDWAATTPLSSFEDDTSGSAADSASSLDPLGHFGATPVLTAAEQLHLEAAYLSAALYIMQRDDPAGFAELARQWV
jgi:hypothetical protein